MAYSFIAYTGNGSTTQYNIPFNYVSQAHIKVYVNFVDTAYTYANATTIQLASAPGNGLRVEVRRVTPLNNVLVDYTDGATLVAADLDTTALQNLYLEQELDDNQKRAIYVDDATGLMTAGGQRITNVANPTAAQDAATKNYVDTADALKVAKAGDSMTGALAMGTNKITGMGNPTSAQDAATKTYVDTADALKVAKAGDSMTGALAMGTNKITGLGTPTVSTDAVTKAYVDATVSAGVPDGDKGDITVSGVGTTYTIDNGAVIEAKLGTGAVTETKLGTGAVTSTKILDGTILNADVNASAAIIATKLSFLQAGTSAVAQTVSTKLKEVFNVKDFGAVGDGVTDDTVAIQAAIDAAGNMFNQVAFPPAGGVYDPPIVLFAPGAYRLTNTLNVYIGLTLSGMSGMPFTVEHTRLIMDTLGGTVNLTKNILNLTVTYQSVPRSNNVCLTIQDLGFWITNPGSTISGRGGTGTPYNPTTGGSHIFCGESAIDCRIKRCNFYSSPNAGIYFKTGPNSSFNVDECEFDTPAVGIRLKDTAVGVHINQSRFFSGQYQVLVENCTGGLKIDGCDFQYNARLLVSGAAQLDTFMFTNNEHQGSGSADNALFVSNVASVNISSNTFGLSTDSAIYLTDVDNGTVCGNSIDSPGFNTSNSSAATAPAGIRLIGCKNLAVTGNSITTSSVGTYNGFGIISSNNGARTSRSVFTGNYIQTNFTGAAHRSQSRVLNTEITDSLSSNTFDNVSFKENRLLGTTNGVYYAIPLSYQGSAGTVLLNTLNLSFARVYVHVEQISTGVSFEFEVVVTRINFTGLYAIKTVNRDASYGVGNGPHVLTTGNTVLFSISSNQLAITFAYATDPMLFSAIVVGARV